MNGIVDAVTLEDAKNAAKTMLALRREHRETGLEKPMPAKFGAICGSKSEHRPAKHHGPLDWRPDDVFDHIGHASGFEKRAGRRD